MKDIKDYIKKRIGTNDVVFLCHWKKSLFSIDEIQTKLNRRVNVPHSHR